MPLPTYPTIEALRRALPPPQFLSVENLHGLIDQAYELGRHERIVEHVGKGVVVKVDTLPLPPAPIVQRRKRK